MNGNEFLLALLCLVFINGYGVDCVVPKPKIQVIPSENNFIEDKPTVFRCHIEGSPTDARVTWLIRNRETRISTFISSNFSREMKTASVGLAPGQKSTFAPIMRRDLEDMEVVCRTANMFEDSFRIPKINRTIPIEDVRFGLQHQVRGRKLRVYCDVLAEPGVVKDMFFRVPASLEPTAENRSLGNGWIRFTPDIAKTKIADASLFSGLPIQCFAVTKHEKSNFGNVMTPITGLIVNYLEFLGISLTNPNTLLGENVTLNMKVAAHPRPPGEQFFLVRADGKDGGERNWSKEVKINSLDLDRYDVQVQFAPQKSGTYKVVYECAAQEDGKPIFTNSTQNFTLDVFHLRFLNVTSHWHDKILDRPTLITMDFLLSINQEPRKDQLLLQRYYNEKIEEEAVQTLTRIFRFKKNLYRVELSVSYPKAGIYVPVFKSGSLDVFGPEVRIKLREENNTVYVVCVVLAVVLLLLPLLLLLAPVVYFSFRRKRKLKTVVLSRNSVSVRFHTAGETVSLMANSKRSWSKNLVDLKQVDPRASKFMKIAVNGEPVLSPRSSRPRAGDRLTFVAPTSLRLNVVDATSWKAVEEHTLELDPEDLTWGDVRQRAQVAFKQFSILDNCAAILFGRYYTPKKLALRIHQDGEIFNRDELTGKEVLRSATLVQFRKFLTPHSYFRWPKGHCPLMELRINTHMLLWKSEEPPTPYSDTDLKDVVAFVQVLADNRNNRFVRLYGYKYFHCRKASIVYTDNEEVVKNFPLVPKEAWINEFLFFTKDEELPTWQVPDDELVYVNVREGLTLKIKGRRIAVTGDNNARLSESEWVAPESPDKFQRIFSKALRGTHIDME